MIIQGKNGSLNLFYNDLFISSFPLGNNNFDDYKNQSEKLILNSLKNNRNLKDQIKMYKNFCDIIFIRKKNKMKISGLDHQKFSACLLALIRLKYLDLDDNVLIMNRRKNNKKRKKFNQYY